jgi:hypothetical protein
VDEVVGALVGGEGPAVARREVLRELDAGTVGGAQARDVEMGADDGVEALLLRAPVLALARDAEAEPVRSSCGRARRRRGR